MRLVNGFVGGATAGLLGAILWAAVAYFTHYEVGIVAGGIGLLVGFGTMLGSRSEGGPALGVIAAITAAGAILLGKWLVVGLILSGALDDDFMVAEVAEIVLQERLEQGLTFPPSRPPEMSETYAEMYPSPVWAAARRRWDAYSPEEKAAYRSAPTMLNPHLPLVFMADTVCYERMDAGETIEWPGEFDVDTAWRQVHYPEDIWAEALRRWDAFSPDEQEQYVAWVRHEQEQHHLMMSSGLQPAYFFQSFTAIDFVWVFIALGCAFQLANSSSEEEEALPAKL